MLVQNSETVLSTSDSQLLRDFILLDADGTIQSMCVYFDL